MSDFFLLTTKASFLLAELRTKAIEEDVICMQAPLVWDGDNPEDIALAKKGCNGVIGNATTKSIPPCPLRKLCLETAIETNSLFGVWGGKSAYERKSLIKKPSNKK
jgi:hypothetical protein